MKVSRPFALVMFFPAHSGKSFRISLARCWLNGMTVASPRSSPYSTFMCMPGFNLPASTSALSVLQLSSLLMSWANAVPRPILARYAIGGQQHLAAGLGDAHLDAFVRCTCLQKVDRFFNLASACVRADALALFAWLSYCFHLFRFP